MAFLQTGEDHKERHVHSCGLIYDIHCLAPSYIKHFGLLFRFAEGGITFSLLLLEPGEIYFEDFSVFYYPMELSEPEAMKRRQRGRMKICSKSIVFDPSDVKYPILKILLQDVSRIDKWVAPLTSKLGGKDNMVLVEASQVIEMKEGNVIAPYHFRRRNAKYLFSLNYVMTEDCIPKMCQLHRASTLNIGDQNAMIAAIVMSRQARVKFDTSWLENLYENIMMESQGDRITPLVTNPGRIMLTSSRLYFQPFNNVEKFPVLKINLTDIKQVIKRRFLLMQVGMEIFCPSNKTCCHLYLSLKSEEERNKLYDSILQQSAVDLEDTGQENMTLKWQNGVISNYEYIAYLNSMADRSINDLTQYPVFPWVIADYTSQTLDLSNEKSFRDLSQPIGALNEERLEKLLDRCKDMPSPKFLYGSHYSTPGYVLFYLARIAPEYMLCLQNGKFDQPDRMFNSMADSWNNCLTSYSDFKELIPEFYDSSGDFLVNNLLINFGQKQDGKTVNVVDLPPWAKTPEEFVKSLRNALECDYVSQQLHKWIDLIFGYKQRGEEAEKAHNVFYYLTYEGAVDLETIVDLNEREALKNQIMEFGQTPKQLFQQPHPQRFSKSIPRSTLPVLETPKEDGDMGRQVEGTSSQDQCGDAIDRSTFWSNVKGLKPYAEHTLHKDAITDVKWGSQGKLLSVSKDTMLKVYSLEEQRQMRSIQLSNMAVSSLSLLPDGKTVLIGSWDNNIYVYSLEYGRLLGTVYAHDDAVSQILWEDGLLVSASWDSTVKFFNSPNPGKNTQSDIAAELDHEAGVSCVCLNSTKSQLAAATREGQIYIWDVQTHSLLGLYYVHTGHIYQVQFSPDDQRLISCGDDNYLRIMDTHTGTEICSKDVGQGIRCLAWDGQTVLAGMESGELQVWDLLSIKMVHSVPGHQASMSCISIDKEGRVLTGGEDGKVIVWT